MICHFQFLVSGLCFVNMAYYWQCELDPVATVMSGTIGCLCSVKHDAYPVKILCTKFSSTWMISLNVRLKS